MTDTCPLCGTAAMEPTSEGFDFASIVERWRTEAGIEFSDATREEFRQASVDRVVVHACSSCTFEMFMPPFAGSRNLYDDIARADYYLPEKWEYFRAIRDVVRYRATSVLDLGCGRGDFLQHLHNGAGRQLAVYGYDINPHAVAAASSKGFQIFDGPFPDAIKVPTPLNAVCSFQVIEHLPDPAGFMRQIHGLLAPGGICILTMPDAEGPVRLFPDALTNIPPHHLSRWRASTVRRAMPRLGFKVVSIRHDPLPDYLWHTYLDVLWDTNIWPSLLCKSMERVRPIGKIPRILWFISRMKLLGVRWLHGVPGLSLYVVLRKVG